MQELLEFRDERGIADAKSSSWAVIAVAAGSAAASSAAALTMFGDPSRDHWPIG
jgi:hypothetical protein